VFQPVYLSSEGKGESFQLSCGEASGLSPTNFFGIILPMGKAGLKRWKDLACSYGGTRAVRAQALETLHSRNTEKSMAAANIIKIRGWVRTVQLSHAMVTEELHPRRLKRFGGYYGVTRHCAASRGPH